MKKTETTVNGDRSINQIIGRTRKVRDKIILVAHDEGVRIASRFHFMGKTGEQLIAMIGDAKSMPLTALATALDMRLNDGQYGFRQIVERIVSFFGGTPTEELTNAFLNQLAINLNGGQPFSAIVPSTFAFDALGFNRSTGVVFEGDKKVVVRGKGKKGERNNKRTQNSRPRTMVNMRRAATTVLSAYYGEQWSKTQQNTLGMTLYVYSPSIRELDGLFGTEQVAIEVAFFGDKLVVTGVRKTLVERMPTVSLMATYDISDDEHPVPAYDAMLTLIKQGWIETKAFGITDVPAFTAIAYNHGLVQAYETWMDLIAQIDGINPAIKAVTSQLATAKNQPLDKKAKALGKIGATVCDDVTNEVNVAEMIGVGGNNRGSSFASSLPTAGWTPASTPTRS